MKRFLLASLLGLAALLQVPGQTWAAGAFGLFTCGGCCKKCGCEVCIRPFNAFSPVLCGSICVENCFPFGGSPCCCAAPMGMMPLPPSPLVPMAPPPMPIMPMPMPPPPPARPPAPMPQGQPLGAPANPEALPKPPEGQVQGYPYPGMMPYPMVQPVSYYPYPYPGYAPYYRPMVPMAPMMPMYPYPMMYPTGQY